MRRSKTIPLFLVPKPCVTLVFWDLPLLSKLELPVLIDQKEKCSSVFGYLLMA